MDDAAQHNTLLQTLQNLSQKLDLLQIDIDTLRRRQSTAFGGKVSLTWLVDDSPIYVNTPDFGSPANLLNGGHYEDDNLTVLFSFLKPHSVVLDVGANLGIFTLQLARRLTQGCVHAFEPQPDVFQLLQKSSFLNGFQGASATSPRVHCHPIALGHHTAMGAFHTPQGHVGGSSFVAEGSPTSIDFRAPIQAADQFFSPDFTCDMVKIDVEGQELSVLQGLRDILQRSPDVVVLFEKLTLKVGTEDQFVALFQGLNLDLFVILPDAQLQPCPPHRLQDTSGYFLATRVATLQDQRDRNHFHMYPAQLRFPRASTSCTAQGTQTSGHREDLLMHGPYWHLPKGVWEVTCQGHVDGAITLGLATHFGHIVTSQTLTSQTLVVTFVVPRDLLHFELIARCQSAEAHFLVSSFHFRKVG